MATGNCRAALGWTGAGPVTTRSALELHRYWFAIGGSGFEELLLLEAEHPGQNVGWERLNLGVQVAHHGVVVAAGILNRVLDFVERILQLVNSCEAWSWG